jgi:hypothetical protein
VPIEIKLSTIVSHHDVRGLEQCMRDLGLKEGFVVCPGRERYVLRPGVTVVPWAEVRSGAFDFGFATGTKRIATARRRRAR